MALVLKNCKTFYRGKIRCVDIASDYGKIIGIGKRISGTEVINCKGLLVFPGLIDVHVHFRVPGAEHKEDWKHGSRAALHGGITCVLDMPNNNPQILDEKSLLEKKKIVEKDACVDYGLYLGASAKINSLGEGLSKQIAGIKLYMSSASGELLATGKIQKMAFERAFRMRKVVAVHAEDEDRIRDNEKKFKDKGISIHHKIRDDTCEAIAIEKVLSSAKSTSAFLHVCHISSKMSLEKIKPFLKSGKVSCGVTPHHLFLTEKDVAKIGNKAKVNPSIKTKKDRSALWAALKASYIKVIESDHAPHTLEEKNADYEIAPSGLPGVETLLPLMLNAYNKGFISLKRIFECCCQNPAKIFGIKNKGSIDFGKDADFCIVNLKRKQEIKSEGLFSKCGWSAFEGWKLTGCVEKTILRGVLCYDSGSIVDSKKGLDVFGGD
ncbi:MAG: dihydroorotase [Candidatus Diapherotrites archaeon]|nr:dihydroorotase [Candidatus Diapherotrites archaeon]